MIRLYSRVRFTLGYTTRPCFSLAAMSSCYRFFGDTVAGLAVSGSRLPVRLMNSLRAGGEPIPSCTTTSCKNSGDTLPS